jgi:hypothetical protein
MENTTTNNDVIEVITELTISDVKTLDFILETCLNAKMFADQSTTVVEQLSLKLKQLVSNLESAS